MVGIDRRALIGGLGGAAGLLAVPARAAGGSAAPPKLPLDAFADKPAMQDLVLSPDGTKVLARMHVHGEEMVGTYELSTGKFRTFALPKDVDLVSFRWAGDDRFLVSVMRKVDYIDTTPSGTMHIWGRGTRLMGFDLKTDQATFIGLVEGGFDGDQIIYADPAGEFILLAIARSVIEGPYVYRIALKDNSNTMVLRPMDGVYRWFADEKGVVRGGVGATDKGWFVVYRSGPDDHFHSTEGKNGIFERAAIGDMNFVSGTDHGYIFSNKDNGRYALFEYDFAKHDLGQCIYRCASNDVESADYDESGHKLEAVIYTDDRPRIVWMNPMLKDLQEGFDRALPERQNWITSRSRDNNVVLLQTSTSTDRGTYYVFHGATAKLKKLVSTSDRLEPSLMAPMEAVTYKARDGLAIPAYLTLPVGREAKGLPLIILPHGGPYGVRDTLGFNVEVQFLANRGYAVLQPNYRGSDGYGVDFHKRGEGEWGRRMQDDLDDGMDWLVGRGIVDPKRAALVGGSYGGYAAAWGATRNPERYRGAACFAGVFDLRTQLGYTRDFLTSDHYREFKSTVRGPGSFDLDQVSPLKHVADLRVPILLVHGDDDSTVPVAQTKTYAAALKHAKKDAEVIIIPGEGHGFREKGSLATWLGKVDSFLGRVNSA